MSKHYSPIVHVKLTTTQRDAIASPESGMEIYNITSNQLEHYNGSAWVSGGSGGGSSTLIGLTDTPSSYGTPGQVPAVNSGGIGLEWVDVTPAPSSTVVNDSAIEAFITSLTPAGYWKLNNLDVSNEFPDQSGNNYYTMKPRNSFLGNTQDSGVSPQDYNKPDHAVTITNGTLDLASYRGSYKQTYFYDVVFHSVSGTSYLVSGITKTVVIKIVDGKVYFGAVGQPTNVVDTNYTVEVGKFYQFTVNYNGAVGSGDGDLYLYINGELVHSFINVDFTGYLLFIGAGNLSNSSTTANMTVSTICYWEGSGLTEQQILDIWNNTNILTTYRPDTLPIGGTNTQVLAKASGQDYDVQWVDSVTSNSFIKAGLQGFFAATVPTSTKLILMVLEEELIFETNAPQSKFKAVTAPSGAVAFDIRRITAGGTDSSIGSIDFANGATDGTGTITAITIPIGDIIYIQSPADVLGLADLFINLVGKNIVPLY